nr:unnamed protein product [Callosobruchus chinensis]CAH7767406.1 unnamed protein product [Callosobruchus chinensis]
MDAKINQYNSSLHTWWEFCASNNLNVFTRSIYAVLKSLTHQFESGCSYSTINTHRAALSQILGPNLSDDFRIKRFFQGLRHLRPSLPKYHSTWDPTVVLNYLKKLSSSPSSLQQLTYKTAMLLALATGQRVQKLASIDLGNLHILPDRLDIHITKQLKTTHTGRYSSYPRRRFLY